MRAVIVSNNQEKPFGLLSNDAPVPLKIQTKVYNTVVNYVYANLLPECSIQAHVAKMLPSDILNNFKGIINHLYYSTVQSAIKEGLREKLKNETMMNALLNTEYKEIIYNSNNTFMGVNNENIGENMYGKCLSQLRNEIKSSQDKSSKEDAIYYSYIAELNLKKLLQRNNLEHYISKTNDRSMRKLVNTLVDEHGKTFVYSNVPEKNTVLAIHEKRNISTYIDPNSLIRIIRKNEIRNILKINLLVLKTEALKIFTSYIVGKESTLSEDSLLLFEQLYQIDLSKREEFSSRILNLYSIRRLPTSVQEKIKLFKAKLYFPSTADIDRFEQEHVKLDYEMDNQITQTQQTNKYFITDGPLSPLNEDIPFEIIDTFPSISKYVSYKVNMLYSTASPKDMYEKILRTKPKDLTQLNSIIKKDFFTSHRDKLLAKAIEIKSKDNHIKNLLFNIESLTIKDSFHLDKTSDFYMKYIPTIDIAVKPITSMEMFVLYSDIFMSEQFLEKVHFYFMLMENIMVNCKYKFLSVSYNDVVKFLPFYRTFSSDKMTNIPSILRQMGQKYKLNNSSLTYILTTIFESFKTAEDCIGMKQYDIRYRNLFIWSKYFLREPIFPVLTCMDSLKENYALTTILSILFHIKEINSQFKIPTMSKYDFDTAMYLCLGQIQPYTATIENVVPVEVAPIPDIEFVEEMPLLEQEQEEEFEGFQNKLSRQKVISFMKQNFNLTVSPLMIETIVRKVLNNKSVPEFTKFQNMNFFLNGFIKPPELD
jgi:predicted NAD-dependent protein-ADP-ribosyltransferase YbiA (DUF1768 family)